MSSSTSSSLTLPSLSLIIGPVEAGVLANAFVTGAFFVQAYIYFTRFPEDRWLFKAVASFLTAFQLAHFVCECAVLWEMTVVAMESPLSLLTIDKPMVAVILLTAIVAFVVQSQSFFVYRLWKISEKSWMPTTCGVFLTCLRHVPGLMTVAKACIYPEAMEYYSRAHISIILAFASAFISDIWVSSVIAYYLWTKRRIGTFSTTSRIIDRLILWTVETGLCICLISSLSLILFLAQPHNYVWISAYALFGSVYANALMAALNGRWILHNRSHADVYKAAGNANDSEHSTERAWENPNKHAVIGIRQEIEMEIR